MGKFTKISGLLLMVFLLSSCKKNLNPNTDNSAVEVLSVHKLDLKSIKPKDSVRIKNRLDAEIKRYNSLLDTNTMDPQKMEAMITYTPALRSRDRGLIQRKMEFLRGSGFPAANDVSGFQRRGVYNKGQTIVDFNKEKLTMSFDNADSKYKQFVSENKKHQFLPVYQQNASTIIIKKYLLNNPAKNSDLQFYTEQLLRAKSQDYPLLFMAIKQLKTTLSSNQLTRYKNLIKNNDEWQNTIHDDLVLSSIFEAKSKKTTGLKSEVMLAQSLKFKVIPSRELYFMHKIYSIN